MLAVARLAGFGLAETLHKIKGLAVRPQQDKSPPRDGVARASAQYQPRAAASAALSMQSIDVDLRPALPSQSPHPTQPSSAYT
jgi:hypothetical protein